MAILFREVMERTSRRLDVKIFATDIDRDAITHASVGMYPESIVGDLPPRILAKYFHPREDRYQIDRSIREMVVFAQHNLTKDPPFTNIDLVSCRNLLIYLQPILQRKVLEMINFSLIPKGILMLGTSETTGEMGDFFDLIHHKFKLYRSKGKHNLVADHADFNMTLEGRMDKSRQRYGARLRNPPQDDVKILDRLLQSLASDYLPLAVVVNEQFEVLQIFGNTEGYFLIPAGKMMNDVTKLAIKELSIPLATGLQKVFRSEDGELRYTNIRVRQGAKSRTLQMRIKRLPGKKTQEPLAVILLDENHSPLTDLSSSEGLVVDINAEAEQRIRDLEQELQFTKENLQATIEELETTNEELQATNEELLASNEELQSTNEELQSVNEELHTVNAEYQSKIIELTELNNDLDNLLASTRIGTLFLDENLEIRKFTPEMTHIFNIMGSDLGRPIQHLVHRLANIDPIQVVREVEAKRTSQSMEVLTQDGDWYLMRVLPYQVGVNAISGVVLTFIEISQMKQVETALVDKTEHLTSLFRAIPIGAGLHVDQYFTDVNDQICEMLGYTRQEMLGRSIEMVYGSEQEFVDIENEVKLQLAQSNFAAVETSWRRKDGSQFPVLYTLAPMHPSDLADGYTFSVQDLSALHNAIELAQSREKQYHRLFTTMMEGVIYHNSQGAIISANPAAERVLGLTLDQLMGRTSVDPRWRAIHEDGSEFPGSEHPAMIALRTGKPVQGVVMGVVNPSDDSIHWIYVNAVPLFLSGSERPDQVYATFDDITDAVQFSRRLVQTQQRLDIALSIADIAWWDLDLQTRKVEASDLKYHWLGFEPAEVEHTLDFWLSRIHPDDLEQAMQCMRDYLAGSTLRYEAQYRLKTQQGEWLRFIDQGEAVERDENGKVLRLVGTVSRFS